MTLFREILGFLGPIAILLCLVHFVIFPIIDHYNPKKELSPIIYERNNIYVSEFEYKGQTFLMTSKGGITQLRTE